MSDSDQKQKFMFDIRRFDAPKPEDEQPPEPVFTESEVEKIKLDSIAYGKTIGLNEATTAREEVLVAVVKHLEQLLLDLIKAEDIIEEQRNRDVINLSLKIVQKLFPKLLEDNTISEIENMVMEALASRQEEPRIVITVHEDILDLLKERVDDIASNSGFQGKIIIVSGNMLKSDCRVEWANGGAERNCETIFSTIENILSKQLPSNNLD